jgi:glutaredoxin-related protein
MKASKHEYDNRFKDLEVQYTKATITENITVLNHFLDLIDKSWKHTKSILLAFIYMTAYCPVLDYRRFNKTLRD